MRLWHYKLIPFLPDKQLLGQWRELNSIFKKQDKHILINYIYEYDKDTTDDLFDYTCMVIAEMQKRGFKVNHLENMIRFFKLSDVFVYQYIPQLKDAVFKGGVFKNHHNNRYLLQCFFNLQEKYDRGQKDFSYESYIKLMDLMRDIVIDIWKD